VRLWRKDARSGASLQLDQPSANAAQQSPEENLAGERGGWCQKSFQKHSPDEVKILGQTLPGAAAAASPPRHKQKGRPQKCPSTRIKQVKQSFKCKFALFAGITSRCGFKID